ncbi:MAG: serine hydrolase domain-containing protein [Paracoccaceae bacterium]
MTDRPRSPGRRRLLAGLGAAAAAGFPRRPGAAGLAEAARAYDDRLRSVVVARGDAVVEDLRLGGPPLDTPVNVKSVSKTMVALLLGVAIERGHVPSVGARLGDVAPRLVPRGADERVADLTLEDLVTMRAGLERTSGANYGGWVSSRDWVAAALSRPFVAEPGERFLYSTGSFHVLGAVLAEATGRSLHALARDWLGRPLGIAVPPWTRSPRGRYLGGNNMALSPLALATIGRMMLAEGRWQGAQVVPAEWVARSWEPRVTSPWSGDGYGYGWFLTRLGGVECAYARGYGGQMLYVLPEAGLTVAITSDPTRPARSRGYVGDLERLVAETVLPAHAG